MTKKRCDWFESLEQKGQKPSKIYVDYHDNEWGVPLRDDNCLFEFLLLECAQAGLSWEIILKKREAYRQAFDQFNPYFIQSYTEEKIQSLMNNKGIVRNRLKIQAFIENAKAFLKVKEEFGSFETYIWSFVNGTPIQNKCKSAMEMPSQSPVSCSMSKDLKKRGFKFVGPTICYAFMQATGMVNDHSLDCFRYKQVQA